MSNHGVATEYDRMAKYEGLTKCDWVTISPNIVRFRIEVLRGLRNFLNIGRPGTGIMETDDRQVTTVFTVHPSLHHGHTTNRVS